MLSGFGCDKALILSSGALKHYKTVVVRVGSMVYMYRSTAVILSDTLQGKIGRAMDGTFSNMSMVAIFRTWSCNRSDTFAITDLDS